MRRTYSLRTQLTILMVLLVLLQSLSLALALTFSRVFTMLDSEAFRLFSSTTAARAQSFNQAAGGLVANMATATQQLNRRLLAVAEGAGTTQARLYLNDAAYAEAAVAAADTLVDLLEKNSITGALLVLNGSNSSKQDPSAHSAVYIRNAVPDGQEDAGSYLLEVGPIAVSQQYQIATSVRWDLDMKFDAQDELQYAFYHQPVAAAAGLRGAEIERYGYWSAPTTMQGDSQQTVRYTMPLVDEAGNAYGVLGLEISLAHFTRAYLPNTDLPYTNSFYAIAMVLGNNLQLDWFIPSGPLAQVYLKQGEALPLEAVPGTGVYETRLEGLGPMYCAVQPLELYSRNSPFHGESWSLVGYVPQGVLHESSLGVRTTLVVSIAATTLVAFAAIFLLVSFSTRKIKGLSRYIGSLSPTQDIRFERTGMREIDELTAAVARLNREVVNAAKTTSRILELTLLPIGGYEVPDEGEYVTVTEFLTGLLHLPPGAPVAKAAWAAAHARLTAHPAEGHDHIYQYPDPEDGSTRWLRIEETRTEGGRVGAVLDATKEVEEHRRMAHELDYDALTHLFNRTAFKRVAHQKIHEQPGKIGAMIFADLDNLKYINDSFGHDMGDRLIIRAGEMFREFARLGGVVSRISGDEFAIYLHGYESQEEARALITAQYKENERFSLKTPDGSSHRIRCSSGIAWYPQDSDNVTDLLKLSDFAMYEAKHSQKGTVFEFSRQSYQKNAYLLENREAINRLLDEGLIRFAFQPIVDLRTGEVYAYEALMRPLLEDFKSPMEIVGVAAAQSKLGQLERLVLLTAFQAVSDNIGRLGSTKVFINSIPSQVVSEEDLLLLQRRYAPVFCNVVIEITEAENDSPQHLERKVAFIRKTGMKLAIDDFGSGYSNEIRILSMNPDVVKVDIEMIQGIHQNDDKRKLVSNLISFCHPKGIRVVAEGVEDALDLAELIRLEVDYVQGYYTGRPAFDFAPIAEEKRQKILDLQSLRGQPRAE